MSLAVSLQSSLQLFVGQGKYDQAKACARYHIVLVTLMSVVIGGCLLLFRGAIMSLFGVSQTGRADFPLYTPKTRDFGIFVIRREDNANFF